MQQNQQSSIHKKIQPNLAIGKYESRKNSRILLHSGYLLEPVVEFWQFRIYLFSLKAGELFVVVYNLMSVWDQRVHQTKGRSWRTDYPLVLAACHKFGQGDRVCSLHKFSKSAHVGEGQGRTKAFPNTFRELRPFCFKKNSFVYLEIIFFQFLNFNPQKI